jgi:hypothetical protein
MVPNQGPERAESPLAGFPVQPVLLKPRPDLQGSHSGAVAHHGHGLA